MKIIQEDDNILIFEEHPSANPDRIALWSTIALALLFLLTGFYFKSISINMTDLFFAGVVWSLVFFIFFILGQRYTIKVNKAPCGRTMPLDRHILSCRHYSLGIPPWA